MLRAKPQVRVKVKASFLTLIIEVTQVSMALLEWFTLIETGLTTWMMTLSMVMEGRNVDSWKETLSDFELTFSSIWGSNLAILSTPLIAKIIENRMKKCFSLNRFLFCKVTIQILVGRIYFNKKIGEVFILSWINGKRQIKGWTFTRGGVYPYSGIKLFW